MAKISANGSRKFDQASFDVTDQEFGTYRCHYVLRSDGAVLRAVSSPTGASSYDRRRSGYTLVGKLPERLIEQAEMVTFFQGFIDRKVTRVNMKDNGDRAVRIS